MNTILRDDRGFLKNANQLANFTASYYLGLYGLKSFDFDPIEDWNDEEKDTYKKIQELA